MSKLERVIADMAKDELSHAVHRILRVDSLSELEKAEKAFMAKWTTYHRIAGNYFSGKTEGGESDKRMEELVDLIGKSWEQAKHNYNVSLKALNWD